MCMFSRTVVADEVKPEHHQILIWFRILLCEWERYHHDYVNVGMCFCPTDFSVIQEEAANRNLPHKPFGGTHTPRLNFPVTSAGSVIVLLFKKNKCNVQCFVVTLIDKTVWTGFLVLCRFVCFKKKKKGLGLNKGDNLPLLSCHYWLLLD